MKTGATKKQIAEAFSNLRATEDGQIGDVWFHLDTAAKYLVPPTHRIISDEWLERLHVMATDRPLTEREQAFLDEVAALIAGEETDAKAE